MNDYLSPDRLFHVFLISLGISITINVGLPFLFARWQGTNFSEAEPLSIPVVICLSLCCGTAVGLFL